MHDSWDDIIWVNGCFDCLHLGHIELLKFAKSQIGQVYVGIDSDARIRLSKGQGRPYQDENTRYAVLESLKYVDKVMIFDTSYQLESLVEKFKPKMIVIGEEYKNKTIIGSKFCKEIKFFPRIEAYSTTNTLKKIKNYN
jgi:D-beta-D-heptose 7-phosphate kinase/D-beta-D-heptose 1-phosphate adenosyltransferase